MTRFHITGDEAGYIEHRKPILFPELVHGNNDGWSLLNGGNGDLHASLFLRNTYGKGRMYIWVVPDNDADIYRMPKSTIDVLRRTLSDDLYATGTDFSMFTYENGMILYRYAKADLHTDRVRIHTSRPVKALKCVDNGWEFPANKITVREDFEEREEYVADVVLEPGIFGKYIWRRV